MAALQAEIKRGFLRSLYEAGNQNYTLIEILRAFQQNGFNAIKSGQLIISSGGAGHSVSLNLPSSFLRFTQDQVFAFAEEMRQEYDDSVAALAPGIVPKDDGSTDDAIYAEMVNGTLRGTTAFREFSGYTSNFMYLSK